MISQGIATGRRLRAAGGAAPSQSLPDENILQSELRRILEAMEQNAPMSPLMSKSTSLLDDALIHD